MRIALTVISVLGVLAGVVYEIVTGNLGHPVLYLLLVAVPGVAAQIGGKVLELLPTTRPRIELQHDEIRAKRWQQASRWEPRRTRPLTSLYIPMRITSRDSKRPVTLRDASVTDARTGRSLEAPTPAEIDVGSEKVWAYRACEVARTEIANVAQTRVEPDSEVETAIIVQEEGHHENCALAIGFRDNFGRRYTVACDVSVLEAERYDVGTTEWAT
jgi:hypothetical protein